MKARTKRLAILWTQLALALAALAGCLAALAAIFIYVYLDFVAYQQRFPHADWWTYFFK